MVDTPEGPAIEASTGDGARQRGDGAPVRACPTAPRRSRRPRRAAIGCAIVGVLIIGTLSRRSKKKDHFPVESFSAKAEGFLPNRWGVFAILGAGYWLYEKGHFSPVPGEGRAL